jgi:glycosyltransferase involved in cell wall biosynthesis
VIGCPATLTGAISTRGAVRDPEPMAAHPSARPAARPVVHFVTRKPLTSNGRIFKQAASLRGEGYDVHLVGVRRGPLAARERIGDLEVARIAHDPLPERLSLWLRRGGLSPASARVLGGASSTSRRSRLRHAALAAVARAGALPWLIQSAVFHWRAYRHLVRAAPRPAVVHASALNSLLAATLVARRFGVPLVYDATEWFPAMHAFPRGYRRLLAYEERLLLPRVTRFIAVNPAIGDAIARQTGRRPDAIVLNCPPYRTPGAPPAHDLRAAVGVPARTPLLVYSGGVLPGRGVEQAVRALHQLDDVVLAILGEGALQDAVRELAAREGLSERVRFCPYVHWGDVAGFISGADAGIIPYENLGPNHYLCSPGKLFDYVMAGLPVACSDFPYLRSVVAGEAVGTLFDPADPGSIAAAVGRILADPSRYRRNLPKAARRYSWEREEERLLGVYASLDISPPPRGDGAR